MAICLDYQSVYSSRKVRTFSLKYNLIASVLLLGALVTRITIKIQNTQWGYDLARERQIAVDLDMKRRELELERSVLLRPDNLSKAARALGLVPFEVAQAKKIKY